MFLQHVKALGKGNQLWPSCFIPGMFKCHKHCQRKGFVSSKEQHRGLWICCLTEWQNLISVKTKARCKQVLMAVFVQCEWGFNVITLPQQCQHARLITGQICESFLCNWILSTLQKYVQMIELTEDSGWNNFSNSDLRLRAMWHPSSSAKPFQYIAEKHILFLVCNCYRSAGKTKTLEFQRSLFNRIKKCFGFSCVVPPNITTSSTVGKTSQRNTMQVEYYKNHH